MDETNVSKFQNSTVYANDGETSTRKPETWPLHMSANSKKPMSSTLLLILLGMASLYGGPKALIVVIPAALLVWFGIGPILRSGRN
jgi:hypothetical protein